MNEMIGHLSGRVLKIRSKKLILDVGGVGYEIRATGKILFATKVGAEKELWIFTHQTSDSISLFGFEKEDALDFFELLISVNGVGPRSAIEILERPVDEIRGAILANDVAKIAETPGIGKKTAARLILELRQKIAGGDPELPVESNVDEDILDAVTSLGYSKKAAGKVLSQLPADIRNPEEIVKWFLRNA
jgi:Holliday junction DNA helicase RuvA